MSSCIIEIIKLVVKAIKCSAILEFCCFSSTCLGLFQKKIPGRVRRQAIYFSMGGWCLKFSNYMGHWCPTKSNYMGGVEGEERILSAKKREKFYQI